METVADHIVANQPFSNLKVTEVKFNKVLQHVGNTFQFKPVLEVELVCEGRVKPVVKDIAYSFCPFCGVEYSQKESEATNDV